MNKKPRVNYRLFVWDYDGPILASNEETWRAHNITLAHFGIEPESYASFLHRESNRFERMIKLGIPENAQEERASIFFQHYDTSKCGLVEGVGAVLAQLQALDIPSAIVSAHHLSDVLDKLAKFDLTRYFSHVIGDTHHKKEALQFMCARFGVLPSETVFIGDLLSDVLDGKAAGAMTVLFAPADSPHAAEAHHHITHLEQLKSLLQI